MLAFENFGIESICINSMIFRILSEEKRNIKTQAKPTKKMIETIERIITDEVKKRNNKC